MFMRNTASIFRMECPGSRFLQTSASTHYPARCHKPEYPNRNDHVLQTHLARRDQRFGMNAVTDWAIAGSRIDSLHLSALLTKHGDSWQTFQIRLFKISNNYLNDALWNSITFRPLLINIWGELEGPFGCECGGWITSLLEENTP